MTKKYVERESLPGGVLEPDAANVAFRTQQSSVTTLDRDQLPEDFVDTDRVAQCGVFRVYHITRVGSTGEQPLKTIASAVTSRNWLALTAQNDPGSWYNAATTTFSDFKGGNLFMEWSGNGFHFPCFAKTESLTYPLNPKYLNIRLLVNGQVFAERRGVAYMEHWRLFGNRNLPSGDLTVEFQFRMTTVGPDDPLETTNADDYMQAHLFSLKYFAIGRWR